MGPLSGALKVLSILAVLILAPVQGLGTNSAIADNALGLAAKDCASQYCTSKNGLELWLSLEQKCIRDPTPYLSSQSEAGGASSDDMWSPASVGSACAVVGAASMLVGVAAGGRFRRAREQQYLPVA